MARLESGDATCRLQLKDNTGEGYVLATGDNLIFANTLLQKGANRHFGRMGLGTASPSTKLEVADTVGTVRAVFGLLTLHLFMSKK